MTKMLTYSRAQFTAEVHVRIVIDPDLLGKLTESSGKPQTISGSRGSALRILDLQGPILLFFYDIRTLPLSPSSSTLAGRELSGAARSLLADFRRAFMKNAEQAILGLSREVESKRLLPEDAAAILLPYLIRASYAQQSLVEEALESVASPKQILNAALSLHGKNHDHRLLTIADSLLVRNGRSSWIALKAICDQNRKECRYFVNTVATLAGISEEQRREALLRLASNPDLETRQEVLAAVEAGALEDPLPLWEVLAHDRDDDIAAVAADQVAALAVR